MYRIGTVGGVLLAAAALVGCNTANVSGPKASAEISTDQTTVAALRHSWESTHPGSRVGTVDGVLPARRYVSVVGLPLDQTPNGTVLTLLDERQRVIVSGVVIDHRDNRLQVNYEALPPGERDPRIGDLAVWFPGGQAVPPESLQPQGAPPIPETQPAVPATQPAQNMPRDNTAPNPPADNAAPATQPANNPAVPATQPTGGTTSHANEPANAGGNTGNTGTGGANTQQPPDLNK